LVWDEQQPEQRQAYGEQFLGEAIAARLAASAGLVLKTASPTSPEQGLSATNLDATDVIIWWSHKKNKDLPDELAERVVTRVQQEHLALVALHSAHWAKPFVRLMQERAKSDALAQIPAAERATARIEYVNDQPYGRGVKATAPLTPALTRTDDGWRLALPGCIFPAWRADGAPSHLTTLLPEHPLASGLPKQWDIPHTEMYGEPFHVPTPDAVVFEERWDKGEHFRSGCVWQVGKGSVFYFRPGHETYPVYQQREPLLVVENAVRWLGGEVRKNVR
jgi:trehalose utilization protein